jgi:outer membrane biosynthesis protein TonB
MELRSIIRTDIAASTIAHLTLVALIVVISEVRPFHPAAPETVTVDIVTPEQVRQEEERAEEKVKPEAKEKPPEPELQLPKLDVTDKANPAPKSAPRQQAAATPSPQASPEPQRTPPQPQPSPPKPRETNAQPQQPPQQPPPQPMQPLAAQPTQSPPPVMSQPQAAPPAYRAPEPDVTVKYGVMLGLPPELPVDATNAAKDDGGDGKDSVGAKLPAEVIAALRRHLRSCARLPAGVDPTDSVNIKLRTVLATDGTLARPPILIEAPPSAKGVALVKAATAAIQACQPFRMLPPDKYGEWKILDLPFSPRDFGG